jgi:hypothetical protein
VNPHPRLAVTLERLLGGGENRSLREFLTGMPAHHAHAAFDSSLPDALVQEFHRGRPVLEREAIGGAARFRRRGTARQLRVARRRRSRVWPLFVRLERQSPGPLSTSIALTPNESRQSGKAKNQRRILNGR